MKFHVDRGRYLNALDRLVSLAFQKRDQVHGNQDEMDASIVETMAAALCQKHPDIFRQYFVTVEEPANVPPDVKAEAERIFQSMYAEQECTFENFYRRWQEVQLEKTADPIQPTVVSPPSQICNGLIFDPESRRFSKTTVLPPTRRRRKEEFDPYTFLVSKQQSGEAIALKLDTDAEDYLMTYSMEEKSRKEAVADQALRKCAQAAAVLNAACSYRILDIHSERIIR